MKHFPFDAGERKDWQVDNHDDELAEKQRSACFPGCGKDLVEALGPGQRPSVMLLGMGQSAHAVFHDDDRTVDDDPEVEGSEAHQVGTDVVSHHS
ncbi:MAG: hypothetical protein ACD_75C00774G0002 [uncultured bacterium]|nr:MAG: hypothetical protein ACD_75C00774G0002 [uncultured bacterium]